MSLNTIAAFCLGAFAAGASALVAGQQTTLTPGQMTQARVKIENRGPGEAVPVDVRDVNVRDPLRVEVINADNGHRAIEPVNVRIAGARWEYLSVDVPADQDLAAVLTRRGNEGWELTGFTRPATGGATTFLMKRMR
jgi:hypothetical protein